MNKRPAILLVGQTPPPHHGQAEATKMLFDHDWPGLRVFRLRMAYSSGESDVGRFGVGKVFHLFGLILKTWWLLLRRRPCFLYYPPASPNLLPILRDIVYLFAVRPFSKGAIFHFHPGGLAEYVAALNPALRFLARLAYGKAAASIVISECGIDPAVAFGARSRHRVANGLDVPGEWGGGEDRTESCRILYMAGLRESKGIMDLVRTAVELDSRGVDFVFDIAGVWQDKDEEVEFMNAVADSSISDRVIMHGLVTGEKKWRLFETASMAFFPSFYESENFPLFLIEAMAFGLPVVSTRWRGIPEMEVEGKTGILLDVGNINGFADALQALLSDSDAVREMSEASRARYEERYTKAAFLAGMREVFDAAMG